MKAFSSLHKHKKINLLKLVILRGGSLRG